MTKHTDGPWFLDIDTSVGPNEDRNWDIYATLPDGPDHTVDVRICDMADCRDMEFNASLICAAPDLLAAAEAALELIDDLDKRGLYVEEAENLRDAIEKAKRGSR